MSVELFSSLGKIAGLAGLIVGLVLYIILRVMKSADGKKQNGINANQKFSLLKYITIGGFSLGALGILTWAYVTTKTEKKAENITNIVPKTDSIKNIATDSIADQVKDDDQKDKPGENSIKEKKLTAFDSLRMLTADRLQNFDFRAQGKLINMIFQSDLLNCTKLLKVPFNMKCAELKQKLINELQLDKLIKLKDKQIILTASSIPVLKWGTYINSTEVNQEQYTFRELGVVDSSKFRLNYKWETSGDMVLGIPNISTTNDPVALTYTPQDITYILADKRFSIGKSYGYNCFNPSGFPRSINPVIWNPNLKLLDSIIPKYATTNYLKYFYPYNSSLRFTDSTIKPFIITGVNINF